MDAAQRPLSPGAQDCYEIIGRRVPRRLYQPTPRPVIEPSTVGVIASATAPVAARLYTEADFQLHLRGVGPCPFGCCPYG